ncbi:pyridoxamine 5'-phosphate oxidase family protein [Dokdonella ginsengisoli]|uniref:Pyridoxamine 5'-phosphate oxidase family protein n=2 Tax=Dokdonella ginsengisoli TaxID=363846 RepID=A0ABV9QPA0_9GAMM
MQAETAMRTPARHRVQRTRQRASYEREAIHAILDAGMLAHVGFCIDAQPFVIPMLYARDGDAVLLHGSIASRLMHRLGEGIPACLSVTHVDGLVLARSHFHHSVNYRSVVAFGRATLVEDPVHKAAALAHFVDALIPGRAAESRPADRNELAATRVLRLEIEDASAKVRDGGVKEDAADLALPYWAGVVPIRTQHAAAQPDASAGDMGLPASVLALLAQGARA